MTEGLMIAMLVSIALSLLAIKMKSLPIMFIASLGWLVSGLQTFDQTKEVLPMLLMLMLSFGEFFLVTSDKA